jgi:hypothetical protein
MRTTLLIAWAIFAVAGCSKSASNSAPTANLPASKSSSSNSAVAAKSRSELAPGNAEAPAATDKQVELDYIPDDAFAVVVFNSRRAFQSQALAALPHDKLLGSSIEAWSFDPREVEHWLLFFTPPVEGEPLGTPYSPGAIMHFAQPVDGRALIAKRAGELKELTLGGKTYYTQTTQPATAFYLPDERTIVFAAEKQLEKMLSPTHVENPIIGRLANADFNCDAHIVINVEPITPALDAVAQFAEQQAPATVPFVKALADVSMITTTADLSGEKLLAVSIEARDEAAAARLRQLAEESRPTIQAGYGKLRAEIVRAWTPEFAGPVLEITDQIVVRAAVTYPAGMVQIDVAKPPQLDDLGRRLRTALDTDATHR